MAEEVVLKRQIKDLGELVARAERGSLLPSDKLIVAVSEQLVKNLAQLALPREQVIAKNYRVRLETVDVRFRDKHGSVRLDGRVSPAAGSAEDVFAELALFGTIDSVEVDRASGVLRGKVSLIGFELKKVGVFGESSGGRRLIEELARQELEVLESLALPIEIPVRLEQEIALKGVEEGPVRLHPASFPLHVVVADVAAHGQRLWIALDVASGLWAKPKASPSPAAGAAK